jgi:exodeoxyribonuclease V alpha subunit
MSCSPIENLSGSIERVTFHSEESGFCVLKVKAKGQRDLVTVVGCSVSVNPGEYVDCTGTWVINREYGLQFKADQVRIVMPSTLEGIKKYLESGLVKGIGPHFAKRLVDAFGIQVFDIIDTDPNRLMELPGIGQGRRDKVVQAWQDQKVIREIIVFLQSYGVGTARAMRIYKTYGNQAIAKVRENPYRLALDIRGIGFKTADLLAVRLGIARDSSLRAQAGVRHVLQENSSEGHCAMLWETLVTKSTELLEIPKEIIIQAIEHENKEGRLVAELIDNQPAVFLSSLYNAEIGVDAHLKRLLSHKSAWMSNMDVNKAIPWVEEKTGLNLSNTQKDAIKVALQNKVVIITGGPGVGKTTLINSILKIIREKTGNIVLCAPTGRAAKRLAGSTRLEAKTLHRLLEVEHQGYGFKRNETSPLEADVIIVDETSMVDIIMMHALLKTIPNSAALILVGDVDQLPSVGPGAVLANLIESQKIPTVRLTEIFRQAKTSQIVVNAHRVNQGHIPSIKTMPQELTDFYFVEADNPTLIHEKLMTMVTERIPARFGFDPIRQIQVLVPMNRGELGARALNVDLQKRLNHSGKNPITRFGATFAEGDKVIQIVNNYHKDVFNGDIGFIANIDEDAGAMNVLFEERLIEYELDELDELSLAYATTIHKAQGSEYPAVVIPIATQHYMLLERNLLYTGITRGKSLVVVVGQIKAVAMAVRTVRSGRRLTNLSAKLKAS